MNFRRSNELEKKFMILLDSLGLIPLLRTA